MEKRLTIKLVRSLIGVNEKQKATVQTLGLHRLGSVVSREDSPIVRGMVRKIAHLVQVEEKS
jgi:large subunit ribosomal protein L30